MYIDKDKIIKFKPIARDLVKDADLVKKEVVYD